MQSFVYKAVDSAGNMRSGEVEAADQSAAFDQLARMNLTPVELVIGNHEGPWWSRDVALFGTPKFPATEIESFFSQLATMSAAQLHPTRILQLSTHLARHRGFRAHLEKAATRLQDGQPLAQALTDSTERFPERLLQMLDVGERANALAFVSERITGMLTQERSLRGELRQALVYPVILMLMSLLVTSVLVFYLTPTLLPVFTASDAQPPTIIRMMAGLRSLVLDDWPVLLGVSTVLVVAALVFRSTLAKPLARLLQSLPFVGRTLRDRDFLAFCQTLDLMLSSGATLSAALKTTQDAVHLDGWKALARTTIAEVENGGRLSDALAGSPLPDPTILAMLRAGEDGNRLDAVLPTVCTTLEKRTRATVKQSVKLVTPILTLVIGVTVGAIILSTIGAILDLNDALYP